MEWRNNLYACEGNRRLYLYKELEEVNAIGSIPVEIRPLNWNSRFRERVTTNTEGADVAVSRVLFETIDQINHEWRFQQQQDQLPFYSDSYQDMVPFISGCLPGMHT